MSELSFETVWWKGRDCFHIIMFLLICSAILSGIRWLFWPGVAIWLLICLQQYWISQITLTSAEMQFRNVYGSRGLFFRFVPSYRKWVRSLRSPFSFTYRRIPRTAFVGFEEFYSRFTGFVFVIQREGCSAWNGESFLRYVLRNLGRVELFFVEDTLAETISEYLSWWVQNEPISAEPNSLG